MNDNLFEDQTNDQPVIDPNKNYYSELVGEGKRFKDPETLAKSKVHSDQYIKILEKRMDETLADLKKERDQNTTRATLDELVSTMKQQKLSSSETPNAKEDNPPTVDINQIKLQVINELQETERVKKQTENANLVKEKLMEQYGDNYASVLRQQTKALGLTEADVNNLARNHPTVLFRSLGLEGQPKNPENFQSPPRTQQRRDNFAPTAQPERTWSYYQDLKKKNPDAWYDRKTAIQMQEDAIRLGDKFMDGDFYVKGLHE